MLRANDPLSAPVYSLVHLEKLIERDRHVVCGEVAVLFCIYLLEDGLEPCEILLTRCQVGQKGDDASLELGQLGEGLDGAHELFMVFWGQWLRAQFLAIQNPRVIEELKRIGPEFLILFKCLPDEIFSFIGNLIPLRTI